MADSLRDGRKYRKAKKYRKALNKLVYEIPLDKTEHAQRLNEMRAKALDLSTKFPILWKPHHFLQMYSFEF